MQHGGRRPDGHARWETLELPYSILAPSYVAHGTPVILVNGKGALPLPPVAEELLTEYVRLGGTTGVPEPKLLGSKESAKNFWYDWKKLLHDLPPEINVNSLSDIDTSLIRDWLDDRSRNGSHQGRRTVGKTAIAIVDGKVQRIVPQCVDRPGIFVGRNKLSLTGGIRRRIMAADVTLNLGHGSEPPPPSSSWAKVIHVNTVDWVARWVDPVTQKTRYIRLASSSPSEQGSFKAKFELAQKMLCAMPRYIRRCKKLIASKGNKHRQLGVCMWLLGNLGIRVGGVSSGTHGATTLQVQHIRLGTSSCHIHFPGKDGIPYIRTLHLPSAISGVIRESQAGKSMGDQLFDLVTADMVNRQISKIIPGASAKVIRTAQACARFEQSLLHAERSGFDAKASLLIALAKTALFCNHREKCSDNSIMSISSVEAEISRIEKRVLTYNKHINAIMSIVRRGCIGLYTIRTSYIDPRIIFAFCQRNGFSPSSPLCFGASGIQSRSWAQDTPGSFRFTLGKANQ